MTATPRITLEQWRSFIAVVDAGGYAQAADELHKSQSTMTYAVQKIEHLLGIKAFVIQGRKALLTPAGEVLYRRGKILIEEAARLERAAKGLAAGQDAEICLAVEIIFPTWLMLACMKSFASEFPDTRIELIESVLSGTDEALLDGRANLAIGSWIPPGFVGDPIMQVRFIAAAHPDHPLHRLKRQLTLDDLAQHRHLVIRDSSRERSRTPGWLNERRVTVSHAGTSTRAACAGLGYAWYPEDMIRQELALGELAPLPLREGAERYGMLYLIFADRDGAGPAVLRMAELIREGIARHCPDALVVGEKMTGTGETSI